MEFIINGAIKIHPLALTRFDQLKDRDASREIERLTRGYEENPMLGFRGASRYYSDDYRDGFALECRAIKWVREEIGLDNIVMMIPFVRSVEEADRVYEVLAENGLKRGENGLQVYMMCEIPANIFLAEDFADRYDGFSIGSNDLTQLIMGDYPDFADFLVDCGIDSMSLNPDSVIPVIKRLTE